MMRIATLRNGAALAVTCAVWATGCSDGTGPESAGDLAFLVPPASLTHADHMAPPVTVVVRDGRGNTVGTWWDTISVALEGGGALGGTTSRPAWRGNAWFDDLRVAQVGTGYRLVARAPGLPDAVSEPFDVHPIFQSTAVGAGQRHTCALAADGTVYCWGGNNAGQLGTGTGHRVTPTPVQTAVRFSAISSSAFFNCALSQAGEVYCWGYNEFGTVGDGTREDRAVPTLVSLPGPAVMVDAGTTHACALLEDQRAYCWGWSRNGQLGIGVDAADFHLTPVQVAGDHEWASIAASGRHTCGLTNTGEAYCWGRNWLGALGLGHTDDGVHPTPAPVAGGHRFSKLFAGPAGYFSTCGLTTEGGLLCWPSWQPHSGWIGEPAPLTGVPGLVEVVPGDHTLCGITVDRNLYCSGDLNPRGLLPDVEAVSVAIGWPDALGMAHGCFVTPAGDTFCWGGNEYGRLGVGHLGGEYRGPRGVWRPPGG